MNFTGGTNPYGEWVLYICVTHPDGLIEQEHRFVTEGKARAWEKRFLKDKAVRQCAAAGHVYSELSRSRPQEIDCYRDMRWWVQTNNREVARILGEAK